MQGMEKEDQGTPGAPSGRNWEEVYGPKGGIDKSKENLPGELLLLLLLIQLCCFGGLVRPNAIKPNTVYHVTRCNCVSSSMVYHVTWCIAYHVTRITYRMYPRIAGAPVRMLLLWRIGKAQRN